MPKEQKSVDNMLRLINKRLDTALKTLGEGSKLYNQLQAQVFKQFPGSRFIKSDKDKHISISRSKAARETLQYSRVESLYNYVLRNTVQDEVKRLREKLKKQGEKPTRAKIKEEAENEYNASQRYGESIEYLYAYEGYDDVSAILANPVRMKGRRTYEEIDRVNAKADEYRAKNLPPLPAAPDINIDE